MSKPIARRSALAAAGSAVALSGLRAPVAAQAGKSKPSYIFFDFEKADLVPSAREIVSLVVKALRPNAKVTVVGNTDAAESTPDRIALSRASEVLNAIAALDVPKGVQFTVSGRGASQPLVKTGPGVREPQNRRVEITVA